MGGPTKNASFIFAKNGRNRKRKRNQGRGEIKKDIQITSKCTLTRLGPNKLTTITFTGKFCYTLSIHVEKNRNGPTKNASFIFDENGRNRKRKRNQGRGKIKNKKRQDTKRLSRVK